MEFIDLKTQYNQIHSHVQKRMERVLAHGRYIMGPEVGELEAMLASYVGARHAIACANGTDALQMALMALGLHRGDEVVMPAFSYFATAEACLIVGITPVFVDIDPQTYLMDPAKIAAAITPRTRAILPVSLFGQCADVTGILHQYDLPVIEDGAQSFGAWDGSGRSLSAATIGCTSFFPSKPLGCYGDGGMCFTNDAELAATLRAIRIHGQSSTHRHDRIGMNSRLDTLQAAVLLAKMQVFDEEISNRAAIAAYYDAHLRGYVTTPFIRSGNRSVYAQYTIATPYRDAVQNALKVQGIPSHIYYPLPMPAQAACALPNEYADAFPNSLHACAHVLSLPMHPYLPRADQDRVIETIRTCIDTCKANA